MIAAVLCSAVGIHTVMSTREAERNASAQQTLDSESGVLLAGRVLTGPSIVRDLAAAEHAAGQGDAGDMHWDGGERGEPRGARCSYCPPGCVLS